MASFVNRATMFVFRTTRKKPAFLSRLILAVAASVAIQGCGNSTDEYVFTGNVPVNPAVQARQLSIYMIGSDLESGDGAGTSDLNEMVTGLNALTAEQRRSLDLLIAFGGADKAGWRGVKWMNQDQLLRDAEDGVYGNETEANSYLLVDENANMGDPASLTRFLDMVSRSTPTPSARFTVLWDHGGSYGGYGPDEVFDKAMDLDEIDAAFANSTLPKVDMVGFDACLMASMEVGKTMRPYGSRLIASEETEPGHGWDYRYVVPAFVRSDTINNYAIGLVDNFVDSANHPYESPGKCLSVVNLDAYSELEAQLTAYSGAYSGELLPVGATTSGFVRATTQAQEFGAGGEDSRVSLDLVDFVQKSVFFGGRDAADGEALLAAVRNYVIYTNDDGSFEEAAGVSIIPPDLTGERLAQANFAGTGWFDLVQSSIALIQSDVAPPQLTDVTVTPDGLVASFADPLLTRVGAVYGLETPEGALQVLGNEAATRIGNTNQFSIDGWDGQTLHLNYSGGTAPVPVPLNFERNLSYEGQSLVLFSSYIRLIEANDPDQVERTGILKLYVREDATLFDYEVSTIITDSDGNVTIDKVENGLSSGDRVRFLYEQLTVGPQTASARTFVNGPEMVLGQAPTFVLQSVVPPAGSSLVYAIVGRDFARNKSVSDLQPLVP